MGDFRGGCETVGKVNPLQQLFGSLVGSIEVGKWCLLTATSSYHFLVSVIALNVLGRALSLQKTNSRVIHSKWFS